MPFEWKEYLEIAQFLMSSSGNFSSEAAFRCATSRAYYAAFCHACNYAIVRQGFVPSGTYEDHGNIKTHFIRNGMRNIADDLDKLRQSRNHCDYENNVFQPRLMAENAIKMAQKVLNNLIIANP